LKSIVSNRLTKKEINKICLLKDKQWKYGFNSQVKWFKNNIKKYDIHNLLFINSKIIGYTLLRKRTCKIININKKIQYLLFDTLTIDKKYRNKKLSSLLMSFNNAVIKQSGFFSFLICSNNTIKFYEKNTWKRLNEKLFDVADHTFSTNGMIFNKKTFEKKVSFFINK